MEQPVDGVQVRQANGVHVAIARGVCGTQAVASAAACDVVYAAHDAMFESMDAPAAQRAGIVTRCVAADELDHEVDKLLCELAAKDPLVLRFTRRSLRQVGAVDWDDVVRFNADLLAELKAEQADAGSPRADLVASFLAGKSKPGLGR